MPGGSSSHPIAVGEHESRHLFFPKWIMEQSQVSIILHATDNRGQGRRPEESENEADIAASAQQ